MPPVRRDDPYPSHNFQLIVNGISDGKSVSGAFTEITNLEVSIEPIKYRNGIDATHQRQMSGLTGVGTLECKRGFTADPEFWRWIKEAINGNIVRAEGAIVLKDAQQSEVARWKFSRGWPCKYTGPSFNATTNEIAFETVSICIEELLFDD
jgi:phage tail-like protein